MRRLKIMRPFQHLSIAMAVLSVMMLSSGIIFGVVANDSLLEKEVQEKLPASSGPRGDVDFIVNASKITTFGIFLGALVIGLQAICVGSWAFGSFYMPMFSKIKSTLQEEVKATRYHIPQGRPHAT